MTPNTKNAGNWARPRRQLVAVSGDPGHGKTHLAKQLGARCQVPVVHTDEVYVDFVRRRCPELFFPHLEFYIQAHFHGMVGASEYNLQTLGRDYNLEWQEHLGGVLSQALEAEAALVVEGYLLAYCPRLLERVADASGTGLMRITVRQRTCWRGTRLVEEAQLVRLLERAARRPAAFSLASPPRPPAGWGDGNRVGNVP